MFIDVTRYGGMRIQRLAIAAIAYLDAVEGGCAIHLLGGETMRVNEDPAEIEARAIALNVVVEPQAGAEPAAPPPPSEKPPVPAPMARDTDRYPAKRAPRGGNRQ